MSSCIVHDPRHDHWLHDVPGTGDEKERHVCDTGSNCRRFLDHEDDETNAAKDYTKLQRPEPVVDVCRQVAGSETEGTRDNVQRN